MRFECSYIVEKPDTYQCFLTSTSLSSPPKPVTETRPQKKKTGTHFWTNQPCSKNLEKPAAYQDNIRQHSPNGVCSKQLVTPCCLVIVQVYYFQPFPDIYSTLILSRMNYIANLNSLIVMLLKMFIYIVA